MLNRAHLEAFLEIVDQRSIQAASRRSGRSRATFHRYLAELRETLGGAELLQRAPGQREGLLTPEGEELARRARVLLRHWDQWLAATKDAVSSAGRALRVGAVAGSFDLLVDVLDELRASFPDLPVHVIEFPGERLLDEVAAGAVDLGIGTAPEEDLPRHLSFELLGRLDFALIAPEALARRLPDPVPLSALEGVPMIVPRTGPQRERLERVFSDHPEGPLLLHAVAEVESTPRMVELVARGFGAAIVSRFRLAFVPPGVVVRALVDGPPPADAGVFTRKTAALAGAQRALVDLARARFQALASRAREERKARRRETRRPKKS